MHNFVRSFIKTTTVTLPIDSVTGEISYILEDKSNKNIIVKIDCHDSDGNVVGHEEFVIYGENFDLLMSESPEFAPNKPVNEYREIDLWYIIELVTNQNEDVN